MISQEQFSFISDTKSNMFHYIRLNRLMWSVLLTSWRRVAHQCVVEETCLICHYVCGIEETLFEEILFEETLFKLAFVST